MFLLTKKTIIALFCLLFQLQPSEGKMMMKVFLMFNISNKDEC